MKTKFRLLSILFITGILFTSCGSNDCLQADWVGTFELVDGSCNDPSLELDQMIVITAGMSDNSVIITGIQYEFEGCEVDFGLGNMKLDGDNIDVSGFGCSGTYIRQ